ncbi:ATP-binding protein [Oleomonas cavernae]|uniref:ATP-binding protein n=1 Tax=Oleomonas cavernae TaxID=2320859 RepID=A0A418WJC6_9PROT|nr:ATP-binding protein [Oleomonas cavernae]RJF90151.1 ATP-binding protein [Oleomonas cavernae]
MPATLNLATLHLVCGKIAAGKSTLCARLSAMPGTVLISEDHWLARLYPGEQASVADYVRNAARLRSVMGGHVETLLRAGLSVVLDFPANTLANRQWMRSIFEAAGADHQLHYLDVPDAVCKARLKARNLAGAHDFAASEAEFDLITSYFVAPTAAEGFNLAILEN